MGYSTPATLGEKARPLEPDKAPGTSEALEKLLRALLELCYIQAPGANAAVPGSTGAALGFTGAAHGSTGTALYS